MGFLDKAKEQATSLGKKAQEGISQGQDKLNDAQAKRKAGSLLEELGSWEWAARQERDGGVAAEQLERIRAELAAHEAEHGPIDPPVPLVAEAAVPAPPPPTQAPPDPPAS